MDVFTASRNKKHSDWLQRKGPVFGKWLNLMAVRVRRPDFA